MQQTKVAVAGATGRLGWPGAREDPARRAVPRARRPAHGMGRQGEVIYLPRMRTQIIAARTVAEALAAMATSPDAEFAPRHGDQVRIEEVAAADPDSQAAADGSLLPGPRARLAGPTFGEWLATQPDSGTAA